MDNDDKVLATDQSLVEADDAEAPDNGQEPVVDAEDAQIVDEQAEQPAAETEPSAPAEPALEDLPVSEVDTPPVDENPAAEAEAEAPPDAPPAEFEEDAVLPEEVADTYSDQEARTDVDAEDLTPPAEDTADTADEPAAVEDVAPEAEVAAEPAEDAAPEADDAEDLMPATEDAAPDIADEPAAVEDAAPEAEVAAEPAEDAAPEADDAGDVDADKKLFLAALSGESFADDEFMFQPLKRGQIIDGTIAGISDSEILVDVGAKSEGLIAGRELESLDPEILGDLAVGDDVRVYVLNPEDSKGHILLSLRRALEEQDWQVAEEHLESKQSYESKVQSYNKGGLIVPFGRIRGFVPASQVSMRRRGRGSGDSPEERWGDMVNEPIMVKVIEVDRGRNRLILSERAAERELREKRRATLIDELSVHQRRKGRVVRLTDFGAFVDLGGADGLVHLSELSWKHVNHPREVVNVGDEIEVEVISLDPERQRIGLSLKNCLADPWTTIDQDYTAGQLVQGKVTKLTKFGAFASIVDNPAIEGLIHISELADHRVKHPREVLDEGDVVTLRIIRIEPDRRRLGLSLKQVDSEEYMFDDWQDFVNPGNS